MGLALSQLDGDGMDTVDVIIPTFGDLDIWSPLAERAVKSAYLQTTPATAVVRSHGANLGHARNMGGLQSKSKWLIFLDADDELDIRYVEHMMDAVGDADLYQPSTLGITDGVEDDYPVLIPPKQSFMEGNHLIIGTMIRKELFVEAGAFDPELPVLEDWDLWIRCALAGGTIKEVPEAIYRVHVRPQSRNTVENGHHTYYSQIQQRYRDTWYARGMR